MSSRSRTPPPAPPNSPIAGVRGIGRRSNERGQQGTRPNLAGDGPWVVPRQSRPAHGRKFGKTFTCNYNVIYSNISHKMSREKE